MNSGKNVLAEKSYNFALQIIRLYKNISNENKEYVLTKQVLRSGTAIGAMIRESEYAQSKPDFISKLSIALKEANETEYWLSLLRDSDYLEIESYKPLSSQCTELIKMLTASITTVKRIQK
jgi:four helix bundle protein